MMAAPVPFELQIAIADPDIDALGHVNNIIYLRWVQTVAIAHWRSLAPPADQARTLWLVLRHEIDYKLAAYRTDSIVARTWIGSASRLKFERFTEILRASDRALLAKARTVWCPVDAHTLRPSPISAELRALFSID